MIRTLTIPLPTDPDQRQHLVGAIAAALETDPQAQVYDALLVVTANPFAAECIRATAVFISSLYLEPLYPEPLYPEPTR